MPAERAWLADVARRMGLERFVPARKGRMIGRYIQPLELIDGMPAAPELGPKFGAWSVEAHPARSWAQVKVDGLRAFYLQTRVLSREALPLDCALHCLPALHALEEAFGEPMVIDGEYQEPAGFNATLAAHKRGEGIGTFWIFDAVPYREWRVNRFTQPFRNRMADIAKRMPVIEDAPFVKWIPAAPLEDADEAQRVAAEVWASGGEGIVVKRSLSLYTRGKTNDWLKLKRHATLDVWIKDAVIEDGRLKTLLVDVGGGTTARIGSAIPEALRGDIGRNPEPWQGRCIEVGFTERTEAGALRGGYFVRLRPDKDGIAGGPTR